MEPLLQKGIYAVINPTLQSVYIGHTEANFLIRFLEHLIAIERYTNHFLLAQLLLHDDTQFQIVQPLNASATAHFLREQKRITSYYNQRGWFVFKDSKTPYMAAKDILKHVITFLSTINVKRAYSKRLYSQVYRRINHHFQTDLKARALARSSSILHTLTSKEISYALLDLYPRYRAKRLHFLRHSLKPKASPAELLHVTPSHATQLSFFK